MGTKIDEEKIFDIIDAYIESLPKEVLEKVRQIDIEEGRDTEIIDKALKNKREKEKQKKKETKEMKGKMIDAFVLGLFDSNATKRSINDDYEDYQYEDEELEEDDYHFDDLD